MSIHTPSPNIYTFALKGRHINLFHNMTHWAKTTIEVDMMDWQQSPYKKIVDELGKLKISSSTSVITLNVVLTREALLEVLKALAYSIWLFLERPQETHDVDGYSCAEYQALYFKLSKDYIGINI